MSSNKNREENLPKNSVQFASIGEVMDILLTIALFVTFAEFLEALTVYTV